MEFRNQNYHSKDIEAISSHRAIEAASYYRYPHPNPIFYSPTYLKRRNKKFKSRQKIRRAIRLKEKNFALDRTDGRELSDSHIHPITQSEDKINYLSF